MPLLKFYFHEEVCSHFENNPASLLNNNTVPLLMLRHKLKLYQRLLLKFYFHEE